MYCTEVKKKKQEYALLQPTNHIPHTLPKAKATEPTTSTIIIHTYPEYTATRTHPNMSTHFTAICVPETHGSSFIHPLHKVHL